MSLNDITSKLPPDQRRRSISPYPDDDSDPDYPAAINEAREATATSNRGTGYPAARRAGRPNTGPPHPGGEAGTTTSSPPVDPRRSSGSPR
jgi:hypothetical protein